MEGAALELFTPDESHGDGNAVGYVETGGGDGGGTAEGD